jgi:hypothetical protein
MTESSGDLENGLAVLTGMSLLDLAKVDDVVLEDALDRLLPEPGEVGDRLWDKGGCAQ